MRGSVKTDEEEEETEGGSLGEMADDVGKKTSDDGDGAFCCLTSDDG